MADIAAPKLEDSQDSWLVYADALQSAGDPRGELIMLNQAVEAGASAAARDAFLDRHADAIFGELARFRGQVEIDWKWCVPRSLSLKIGPRDEPLALAKASLSSPLGAQMQTLRLVALTPSQSDRVNLVPALLELSKGLSTNCTALELIDDRARRSRILVSSDYSPSNNLVDFGNLNTIWAIPQLQRVHLVVADTEQVKLGQIDAPELRDFAFLGLRWGQPYRDQSEMAQTLAAAKWPKLQRLALRIPETYTYSWPDQDGAYVSVDRYDEEGDDEYMDDEGWHEDMNWSAELGGLLDALLQTKLEQLSLTSFASASNLLVALAEHGLPASLQILDLSASDLGDEAVGWMLEHRQLFASLKTLDLRDTLIDDASPLAALGPEVLHSSGGGAIYRFSVGME